VGGGSRFPTPGFVSACPRLTELTVICPHPHTVMDAETGYLLDPVGSVRSAMSELVNACKGLPDFNTFQIVHGCRLDYSGEGLQREQANGAKDVAIKYLKELETGCREGEGRKKTTVRLTKLIAGHRQKAYLDSVKVEVYEV
jgi:hypothetical protein